MKTDFLTLILMISPALLILLAILSKFYKQVSSLKKISTFVTVVGLLSAVYAISLLVSNGMSQTSLLGINGLGFAVRIDRLTVVMYSMISILAFVIMKFSHNYLDGDQRQGIFIGRLAVSIAMVQLLVLSGNLFMLMLTWIGISLALHRLLVFYPNRPKAIVAAKKKFIFARIGDFFLLTSIILLYRIFGTGDLGIIFTTVGEIQQGNIQYEIAIICLVIAALVKSAQFPLHGWLVEVMETPTPVSAMLHAGLLNAGPFLMIRMAFLLHYSNSGSALLIVVGGLTAVFAAISFTTQPAQKTALAYSSIAHMGFSLLTSGFGLYPAALLHLVGHSFYKGHAFLSSGTAVEIIRAKKVLAEKRTGNVFKMIFAFTTSIVIYVLFSTIWGVRPSESFGLFTLGIILMLALTLLLTTAFDSTNYIQTILKAILLSVLITNAFFAFELGVHHLLESEIPPTLAVNGMTLTFMVAIVAIFALAILIQIVSPRISQNRFTQKMGIHFRNGLYVNAYFDKWIGALSQKKIYRKIKIQVEK
jgi:NAD(P)H-quinone oxidoreductase subunit 5